MALGAQCRPPDGRGRSRNHQRPAVDSCDIVIAVFDSRLGTQTAEAVSGTAEEITRASKAGKPVHVYFSSEQLPHDTPWEELKRLDEFKAQLRQEGLLGEYANPNDLQNQVHRAIEYDVSALERKPARQPAASLARPRAVTCSVESNPLGPGIWNVIVNNGSSGPITDLEVAVYLVDSRGERTADQCMPAKNHQSLGDLMGKVVREALRGSLGSVAGVYGGTMADHLAPRIQQEMLRQAIAQMQDSFPAVLPADRDTTVAYIAEGDGQVRADITFTDEVGNVWFRPHGKAPVLK
ncbi:hypothetical protein ACIBEH_06025 [Nocardia salmonicida]|uniref:hypothetical protein n=1 Tax=Nocardia salmonicida TaxID=53431 RepID=UPI00379472D2